MIAELKILWPVTDRPKIVRLAKVLLLYIGKKNCDVQLDVRVGLIRIYLGLVIAEHSL